MGKHHTEDYKLSAVKYALRTDNQVETCEVFDCKRASLQRWIEKFRETGSPIRTTRRQRTAYKVKKEYVESEIAIADGTVFSITLGRDISVVFTGVVFMPLTTSIFGTVVDFSAGWNLLLSLR